MGRVATTLPVVLLLTGCLSPAPTDRGDQVVTTFQVESKRGVSRGLLVLDRRQICYRAKLPDQATAVHLMQRVDRGPALPIVTFFEPPTPPEEGEWCRNRNGSNVGEALEDDPGGFFVDVHFSERGPAVRLELREG